MIIILVILITMIAVIIIMMTIMLIISLFRSHFCESEVLPSENVKKTIPLDKSAEKEI